MTLHRINRDGTWLHARVDGATDPGAPTIMFSNSLGTTLEAWDDLLPFLPDGLRIIRYDMRGHGQSDVPAGPYSMGTLVRDAEAIADELNVKDAMFVGLSVGGMIGQGLAIKRLDLVRALVLSNTAAKIGTPKLWSERIDMVTSKGMAALADGILERWFSKSFRQSPEAMRWRDMLLKISPAGYAGVCSAIAGTDFYTPTSGLRLPVLGVAGNEDRATPPDLVRETVDLVPGSKFVLMRGVGHIPVAEDAAGFAAHLNAFLDATGHMAR